VGFSGQTEDWTAGWIAALATLTAAVTGYVYAGRYQYLIVSYQATATQLRTLKTRWQVLVDRGADAAERDRVIRDFESALSVENSAWMARWLEEGNAAPQVNQPVAGPAASE
jgi:hypothetical protein